MYRQEMVPEQQPDPVCKMRTERRAAQVELERVFALRVLAGQHRVSIVNPVDRLPVDELATPVPMPLPLLVSEDRHDFTERTILSTDASRGRA
jgi:hypothetical protein